MKRELRELQSMQAAPLTVKISLTKSRIRQWIDEFGEDGVYVSFSGGKDSTVLLDIVRQMYPNIKAVFIDTGLEYPEIKEFIKTYDNVDIVRPKKTFKQVLDEYGIPFFSKDVSECVYRAKKYLEKYKAKHGVVSIDEIRFSDLENIPIRLAKVMGWLTKDNKIMENIPKENMSAYDLKKYQFMLNAPFYISHLCCNVMKKTPGHRYSKKNNRKPITAQMASESRFRTQQWLKNGCNGFQMKEPISNPMSFWTEQDVLLYIYLNKLPIASVYGDIIPDRDDFDIDIQDQLAEFEKERVVLSTTGCNRTGCIYCGFGCHLEKDEEARFVRLKETHPKLYDYIMKPEKDGGLGYKEKIDWINENGDFNIKY